MDLQELAQAIATKADVALRPASASDLAQLRALGAPPTLVAFYELFEPAEGIEFKQVRIWPASRIVEENRDYVPGADLHHHGYVVFATTEYGDTYCFDPSEPGPSVIIMTHEVSFDELAADEIKKYRKVVAADFTDFLQRFLDEQLDIEPLYDPAS